MEKAIETKKEILERLKELCSSDDIEAVNAEVNELMEAFKEKMEAEKEEPKESVSENDENEITAVEEKPIDEDFEAYRIITEAFKEKKSAFFKRRKEEEDKNFNQKNDLLAELKFIISDEENIGKAFARVNEIKDKWNEIGSVGRMREQEVQSDYSKLMEEFYYNIKIYKEIKDHDLKRNHQLKEDVINQLKKLLEEDNIKTIESSMRALQNDWESIGGTYQEKWEELKDSYWTTVKALYNKIRDHYEGRRRMMEQNLETKKELLSKTEELVKELPDNHKQWDKQTKLIIDIQEEWKKVGPAPRKENNETWKTFRSLCDSFFSAKKEFYGQRHEEFSEVKEAKEKLIEQVGQVKNSNDWKGTANQIIKIQKQWKQLGTAGPKYEQKLWNAFRKECDFFFNRRDEHFAKLSIEEDENLKKKQAFIQELQKLKLPKENKAALGLIEEKTKEYQAIGNVPFKERNGTYKTFKDTINSLYDQLDLKKDEKEEILFKSKVETLKAAPDAGKKMGQEKDKIRKQIKILNDEIIQYENNLGFFANTKGTNPLKKQVEDNIEERKEKVEALKQKLSLLR